MEPFGPKIFNTKMLGQTAMERADEVNRAVEAYGKRYGSRPKFIAFHIQTEHEIDPYLTYNMPAC